MKKILFVIAGVLALAGLFATFTDDAQASIYPYGYSGQWTPVNWSSGTAPAGWNWIRQTMAFTAATDTMFALFSLENPDLNNADTLLAIYNTTTKPASGAADTVNVQLELWTASDTAGWRCGNITLHNDLWTKYTIGRDSTATGFNYRQNYISTATHKGKQPFYAVVAIGKAALTNGKGNEAGVRVQVDVIEQ